MGRATFKIGLNRQFTGKPAKIASINYAVDWEPCEVTAAELIAHSRSRHPSAAGAAIASSLKLGADLIVRLKDGSAAELARLAPNTSVACPYHADEHPSAFVVRSNRGANGIHCMACNATFWTDGGSPYDFSTFDKLVEARSAKDNAEREVIEGDDNPFVAFFPPAPNVFVHQTKSRAPIRYLEIFRTG